MSCFEGKITNPASNKRRIILGICMQMMQQLTGINFIFYFGTVFFQQLGSIKDPFLISLVTTLVNVLPTPASFFTVEKIGRRPILIFGAAGMVIMQFIVSAISASAGKNTANHPANSNATRAMIAFICLNISVFATTWRFGAASLTKGLTLEQVDKMLEETTPRNIRKWKPHSTFASEMHLVEKHLEIPVNTETVGPKTGATQTV
ncbi:hypothetical protein N0V94_008889 [Neodidymelliopsis sp. IMI 364377]|nr:hypothetical protein N0V94_008889 [Neodidymelliopsis sp. IMI 364377]